MDIFQSALIKRLDPELEKTNTYGSGIGEDEYLRIRNWKDEYLRIRNWRRLIPTDPELEKTNTYGSGIREDEYLRIRSWRRRIPTDPKHFTL